MSETKTRNPELLSSENIGKSLLKLSIPAIVGMTVSALYNVVDAAFVGHGAGPLAIGGLTIVFPIQMLITSFAQIFGIGSASIISRRLGKADTKGADKAAGNAVTGSIISGLICTIIGYIFRDKILRAFGATAEIMPYAVDYYNIVLAGSIFTSFALSSTNLARAEGKAMAAMNGMLIGTVLNIILDPLFIFVFNMGIRGAAWATVIGQAASFIYIIWFFKAKSSLKINRGTLLPDKTITREMILLGLPTFVRHAGGSVLAIVINNTLGTYGGNMAIAAYGTLNRILMFGVMPIIGFNQGFQPLIGYNYAAERIDKVKLTIKLAMLYTTAIAIVFSGIMLLIPGAVIKIFSTNTELLSFAVPAARIIVICFSFIGLQSIGSSYFQAIGKTVPAFILGLSRQFILLIPFTLIMAPIFGLNGIWAAFPAADLFSAVITIIWLSCELKKRNEVIL
jgi:putative MATE family efflux protein